MQKQNAEVLQMMQRQREYSPKEMREISWLISKAHTAVARRTGDYLGTEWDRLEQEIAQLERQLMEKYAEQSEIATLLRSMGFQEGLQVSIEIHLEEKAGERDAPKLG